MREIDKKNQVALETAAVRFGCGEKKKLGEEVKGEKRKIKRGRKGRAIKKERNADKHRGLYNNQRKVADQKREKNSAGRGFFSLNRP